MTGLLRDEAGSMVIESAFVIPILVILSLGGFEASRIVSRNTELQSAVAEAGAVVLAAAPDTADKRATVKSIIAASTGLASTPDKVTLTVKFRCNDDTALKDSATECGTGVVVSEYVRINITDSYTPMWTQFGLGSTINYSVSRMVQIA